jgi:CRP-like cAMP-binding protein
VIIRSGVASVEIAITSKRSVLAELRAGDICGEMAMLGRRTTTAAVVARDDQVEVDEISYQDLNELFDAFPRLASRFFHSLAVVLARRLEHTSHALAREMAVADRHR